MQRSAPARHAGSTLRIRLRVGSLALLALLLLWFVVTRGLAAFFAERSPETALFLQPGNPEALAALAEPAIIDLVKKRHEESESPPVDPQFDREMTSLLTGSIAAAPLNPRAFRLLGQLAIEKKDLKTAERYMREATRLSLKESPAVEWMMRSNFEKKNYAATGYYADAFLRVRPQFIKSAAPILGGMAEEEKGKAALVKILAANPRWRTSFFDNLGGAVSDARTPLALFWALKDAGAPPTDRELTSYLHLLIGHRLYDYAYNVWVQFLRPEQQESAGLLFNGSFEFETSRMPFDWVPRTRGGVTALFTERPDQPEKHALAISLGPGRVEMLDISEFIMLPPGQYVFQGALQGFVSGPRGLKWSVVCVDGSYVKDSEMFLGSFPKWRNFEFELTIPEGKCPAQVAKLTLAARSASEQLVTGSVLFDDLSISRKQAPSAAQTP